MNTVTRTPTLQAGSLWALARIEGRRLVTHPAFLAGVVLGLVFVIGIRIESGSDLPLGVDLFRIAPLPLAIGALIAANLNALRSRRHHTEELYDTEPVPARLRTASHLLAVLWAVAATAILIAAVFVFLGAWDGVPVGFLGGIRPRVPTVVELTLGPLAVGLFGVVGVLLARWLPSIVVPLLAVVAALPYLLFESWTLVEGPSGWFAPLWDPAREVGWIQVGGSGYSVIAGFAIAALAWHELYLVGLIAIVSVLALARHGWTRRLTAGAVLGGSAVVAGAVMQVAAATPWP